MDSSKILIWVESIFLGVMASRPKCKVFILTHPSCLSLATCTHEVTSKAKGYGFIVILLSRDYSSSQSLFQFCIEIKVFFGQVFLGGEKKVFAYILISKHFARWKGDKKFAGLCLYRSNKNNSLLSWQGALKGSLFILSKYACPKVYQSN